MPTDILLNDDGDLQFENGDFKKGESTYQHQRFLLTSQKGEWREYPLVGVGLQDYLNDHNLSDLSFEIENQFENDGMSVREISVFENGKVTIDAKYE